MGFLSGPGRNSPPINGSLKSYLYLARDLLWFWIILLPHYLISIFRIIFPKRQKDLKDKVVVVTGGGSGIGKELCLQLSKHGSKIICVDINKESAETTASEISVLVGGSKVPVYECDVSKPEETKKLASNIVAEYGPVDILINNAGLVQTHSILGDEDAKLQRIIDVNIMSHFWMSRAFLPSMIKYRKGQIVAISSISAICGVPNATTYSTSKSAVMGLMYTLDEELRLNPETAHIKLTTIYPYFVGVRPNFLDRIRIRLPALTVEDAVQQMVTGIRREYFCFTVPNIKTGYFICWIGRLLPIQLYRICRDIFYAQVIIPNKVETEQADNLP